MILYTRAALIIGLLAASGCGPAPAARNAPGSPSRVDRAARSYRLVGTVRGVERGGGRVLIRHEAIPGYMPAMTMPFDVSGEAIRDELRVGDEVEGRLVVGEGDARLTDLIITRPATADLDPSGRPAAPRVLEIGGEVPDFALTSQDGAPLKLSDLRGRVVVLAFIYTRCPLPNYCPLTDAKFRQLADRLAAIGDRADRVRLLSVSFDPEHDTPDVLARHARLRGARAPTWTFAVATHEQLRRVAGPLGLTYGGGVGEVVHSLSTAIIDPEGRLARLERGNDWSVPELLRAVLDAASPDGRRDRGGPRPRRG